MKTIREAVIGKTTLRLVEVGKRYAGVVLMNDEIISRIDGDDQDDVWQKLKAESSKSSPNYVGFDGAKNRFLKFFPGGFSSDYYVEMERDYKLEAKKFLDRHVPLESAVDGSGHGEIIKTVFNKTNLLSPFEKMRLKDALQSENGDQFIRGAARMASGEIKRGLTEMEKALKPHDAAKWTVVTYLPFLWRPTDHMFLKPEVTKDYSERVGHSFFNDYETKLNADVYESLLDLVEITEKKIEGLNPQDRIDVQSFIWTVGAYDDENDLPKAMG
jgi:hypothetical protein